MCFFSNVCPNLNFVNVLEILIVAYLLYEFFNLIRGTTAIKIFWGVVVIYVIWKIVVFLDLRILGEIIGQFISVGVIAIIILFQKEIRQFLLLIGNNKIIPSNRKRFLFWSFNVESLVKTNLETIVSAVSNLSSKKIGALVVITRKIDLDDIVKTGILLNAILSEKLIEAIFQKSSPLHDGAIIIKENKIIAARCVLPLNEEVIKDEDLIGLRHRAALGITEQSDAIAIVVSEQTGDISLAINGKLHKKLNPQELNDLLLANF